MLEPDKDSGLSWMFMCVGTIVVVGTLFSLVGGPGTSDESELEEKTAKLEARLSSLKVSASQLRGDFQAIEKKNQMAQDEIDSMERQWDVVERRVGRALSEKHSLIDEMQSMSETHEKYAKEASQKARDSVVGRHIGDFSTESGERFRSAVIRKVTDKSMIISHENGVSTIMAGELSEVFHRRFHWGPEVKKYGGGIVDHRVRGESQSNHGSSGQPPSGFTQDEWIKQRAAYVRYYSLVRQYGDAQRASYSSRSRSVPGSLKTWEDNLLQLKGEIGKARADYYRSRTYSGYIPAGYFNYPPVTYPSYRYYRGY